MAEFTGDQLRNLLLSAVPMRFRTDIPVVPVVRLSGVIGFTTPLRPGITLGGVSRQLERAFSIARAKAVAVIVNSPGGSPVQSHLVYRRIRQLADEKQIPVLTFIEDIGASGGYMVACAGDEIICDPSSIVGSIGVVGATFGLQRAIDKLGIERRIYTAGDRKVMLDPFLPENPEDVARLKAIQKEIHESFIALVRERRGTRLSGPESALFSGEYWTGAQALKFGLVDALGDLRGVLRQRYGEKLKTPLIAERGWFSRRPVGVGSLASVPSGFADDLISAIEARALWARYGL